jgi:photosystem II stability/assembly factor-like uncharacterized protein
MTQLLTRYRLLLSTVVLLLLVLPRVGRLHAQEFLDTAGRWKSLNISSLSAQIPRSITAFNATLVVGREAGSIIWSLDSGENWQEVPAANLPASINTVWSVAFVDTGRSPDHLVGVATFTPTGSPRYVAAIESRDRGVHWSEVSRIEAHDNFLFNQGISPIWTLDSVLKYGQPTLQFLDDTVARRRIGFLSSGAGLWITNDTCRSWVRRSDVLAVHMLHMATPLRGFGFVRVSTQRFLGDLASTTDGGLTWRRFFEIIDDSYRWPMGAALNDHSYRILSPNRHQDLEKWSYWRSDDAGATWSEYKGAGAPRPLWGGAFWLDTADIHIVGDGTVLLHTYDATNNIFMLRDSTVGYTQSHLELHPLPKGPIAARDNRYIYFTGPGKLAARWRFAEPGPRVIASTGSGDATTGSGGARFERVGSRLVVGGASGRVAAVVLYDLLGRERRRGVAEVEMAGLERGGYLVVVQEDGGWWTKRVMIGVGE